MDHKTDVYFKLHEKHLQWVLKKINKVCTDDIDYRNLGNIVVDHYFTDLEYEYFSDLEFLNSMTRVEFLDREVSIMLRRLLYVGIIKPKLIIIKGIKL